MAKAQSSSFISASSSIQSQNLTTYSAKGLICNENIVTTRDRAALVFHDYERNRAWTTDWLAYLSVFIGLLIPLVTTSEFKGLILSKSIIVSGTVCKTIVFLLCVGSGLLGVYCLVRRIVLRKKLKCSYFLEQLRKESVNVD